MGNPVIPDMAPFHIDDLIRVFHSVKKYACVVGDRLRATGESTSTDRIYIYHPEIDDKFKQKIHNEVKQRYGEAYDEEDRAKLKTIFSRKRYMQILNILYFKVRLEVAYS